MASTYPRDNLLLRRPTAGPYTSRRHAILSRPTRPPNAITRRAILDDLRSRFWARLHRELLRRGTDRRSPLTPSKTEI